jgi:hypothetical protein
MNAPQLEELLVSCPAPGARPTGICIDYIERLRAAGVTVQLGDGMTDISLIRCVQAEKMYLALQKHEQYRYVMWLDSDMGTSIECTRALLEACAVANETRQCSVSGAYVNRHRREKYELAAYAIKGHPSLDVALPESQRNYKLIPALTGLGCLIQPREAFMAHCDESDHFAYPDLEQLVPSVTNSRPIHASELGQYIDLDTTIDQFFWHGEDFEYCIRELEMGRLVYVAPIGWAHETRHILVPEHGVIFRGLAEWQG